MKSLKGKSFIKILAFILAFVSLVSVAANCALLAYLSYNGLYNNNVDALARKLYNFAAADTAADVYQLVKAKLYAADPNQDQHYWLNESLIYESRLSEAFSNVSFVVADMDGNVVLSGYELDDHQYEFSYKYVYDNYYYGFFKDDYEDYVWETTTHNSYQSGEEVTTYMPYDKSTAYSYESSSKESTTVKEEVQNKAQTDKKSKKGTAEQNTEEATTQQATPFDSFVETAQNQEYTYFTITILVPEVITYNDVPDLYTVIHRIINFIFSYKNSIGTVIAISLIVFIGALVLLLSSAGYVKNSEQPVVGGLHKIPFDISLLAVIGITLFGLFFLSEYAHRTSDFVIGVAITIVAVLLALVYLLFIESIAVRTKTKTLFPNNLTVRSFRLLSKAARLIERNISLTWKTALGFVVISVADFLVLSFAALDFPFGFFLFFVLKFIEIPVVFLFVYALSLLHGGAKKIADGETNYKIDNKILIGEFKKHAESLNSINNAVNKAVEERVKSENMKTELITNVSHDLKTPLTSIVNYVDLLKKTDIDNDTANEYIEVIDRQAQRLKKLTTDIVDASKAATGNIEVNFEKTLLNVMLTQVNGEYGEALEQKELTLVPQFPENDVCVMADGRLLWRVFDNLLNNICKYSQSYTRVYMTLVSQGTKAQIIFKNISSTPLNINSEELTERFVRGDTSRNTEGSGLGLSIAKSLCELMNADFKLSIDGDLFKVIITFDTIE